MNETLLLRNDLSMALTGEWEVLALTTTSTEIIAKATHFASGKTITAKISINTLEPVVTALQIEDELRRQLKENILTSTKFTDLFTVNGNGGNYVVCGVRRNNKYASFGVTIAHGEELSFYTPSQIQNNDVPYFYPDYAMKQIIKANRVLGTLQQAGGGILVTRAEIVKFLGLPTWEKVSMAQEDGLEQIAREMAEHKYAGMMEDDATIQPDEDAIFELQDETLAKMWDKLHKNYDHAVFLTMQNVVSGFAMNIIEIKNQRGYTTEGLYRLTYRKIEKNWQGTLENMLDLVNGYDGAAGAYDVAAWLKVNDTHSPKEVIYDHLPYLKHAGEVYGSGRHDAETQFEHHMEYDVA